jgi:hypothetical protein
MEEILKKYKEECFSFSQPFLMEVFKLSREHPNDGEFGRIIRKMIHAAEDLHSSKVREEVSISLQKILDENNKNLNS